MYINQNNLALAEFPDRLAIWQHEKGFWSSADISHPFFHAAGHESHIHEQARKMEVAGFHNPVDPNYTLQGWSDYYHAVSEHKQLCDQVNFPKELAEKILAQVGRHALHSYPDFIAEVFVGLLAGRRYDAEIMNEYYANSGVPVESMEVP
jgi:hypothetical protein